jgi:short-subunit dehydrogenase
LDLDQLSNETRTFEVNLMAAVITTEIVVRAMITKGHGHFIGLSSLADDLIQAGAPSYCASKAGVSSFWQSLGMAVRSRNVEISTVRFGFVDTKMAKSEKKPFLLTVDQAADFLLRVMERPRLRASYPRSMAALVWLMGLSYRISSVAR